MALSKRRALQFAVLLIAAACVFYIVADRQPSTRTARVDARRQLTAFELPDLGGRTWKMSEHRGSVVLLNFWATWCPPCRAETPGLVRLAKSYRNKGVEVVGVVMDEEHDPPVKEFLQEFEIRYPILKPPSDSPLFAAITSLPTTLLIDKEGRIARRYEGAVAESQFQRDIDRVLSE